MWECIYVENKSLPLLRLHLAPREKLLKHLPILGLVEHLQNLAFLPPKGFRGTVLALDPFLWDLLDLFQTG